MSDIDLKQLREATQAELDFRAGKLNMIDGSVFRKAASPDVVLALLARVESAERALESRVRHMDEGWARESERLTTQRDAAVAERDELLAAARQCPECEFVYSHSGDTMLKLDAIERETVEALAAHLRLHGLHSAADLANAFKRGPEK